MQMDGDVVLVDFDTRWADRFQSERRRLEGALAPYVLSIDHVGSTAVPGMVAKPTVDILVGIFRVHDAVRVIARLQKVGYVYVPDYEDQLPERRFLRFPANRALPAEVNVHVVEVGTSFYERHLAFRDWLRTHPEDREAYARAKREAAARFPHDRLAYTVAKAPVIRAVEEKAMAAGRERKAPEKSPPGT